MSLDWNENHICNCRANVEAMMQLGKANRLDVFGNRFYVFMFLISFNVLLS